MLMAPNVGIASAEETEPQVLVQMPGELIGAVEAIAASQEITKSDAIRQLIEMGLKAWVELQR
jgi:hypothetical protein